MDDLPVKPARDSKGRYLPGASGNPNGRPKDTVGRALRAELERQMTDGNIEAVISTIVSGAMAGNKYARDALFAMAGISSQRVAAEVDPVVHVVVEYVDE